MCLMEPKDRKPAPPHGCPRSFLFPFSSTQCVLSHSHYFVSSLTTSYFWHTFGFSFPGNEFVSLFLWSLSKSPHMCSDGSACITSSTSIHHPWPLTSSQLLGPLICGWRRQAGLNQQPKMYLLQVIWLRLQRKFTLEQGVELRSPRHLYHTMMPSCFVVWRKTIKVCPYIINI